MSLSRLCGTTTHATAHAVSRTIPRISDVVRRLPLLPRSQEVGTPAHHAIVAVSLTRRLLGGTYLGAEPRKARPTKRPPQADSDHRTMAKIAYKGPREESSSSLCLRRALSAPKASSRPREHHHKVARPPEDELVPGPFLVRDSRDERTTGVGRRVDLNPIGVDVELHRADGTGGEQCSS